MMHLILQNDTMNTKLWIVVHFCFKEQLHGHFNTVCVCLCVVLVEILLRIVGELTQQC